MHIIWRTLVRSNIFAVGLALGTACSSGTHDIRVSSVPSGPPAPSPARDVVLVGNNWEGTVFAFDPNPPFPVLGTFDVVPDRAFLNREVDERLSRKIDVGLIRRLAGEGHDQLVDDVFTSLDGRYLYASRPSYKDVVAIDLLDPANSTPHWRTQVEGRRADHAAISPDGTRLLVSASTAKKVHEIDTASGAILRSFNSGDEPHENNYSHDGTKIFHASIGRVFLPTTSEIGDRLKGDRWFQIVDAKTFEVIERYDMRQKTREFGKEWKDSAVRPMAVTPDDKTVFLQMSFLHGFYEFDLEKKQITRMELLPGAEDLEKIDASGFQLNSADHGITLNGDGTKLCVAGTMTGMAYIVTVPRDKFAVKTIDLHDKEHPEIAPKPYWATTSADGKNCYLSLSGLNQVVAISFDNEERIGTVRVGLHPQRIRNGRILVSALHANGKP